jgi:DNA repair protein RadD
VALIYQARPYQAKGITDIRSALGSGAKSVLYVLATGGGKTFTYAQIADGAASKGNNVLILEHRKELIKQASLALARIGVKHRIVAPPEKVAAIRRAHIKEIGWPMIDQAANVAVASVQTLGRRLEWLELFRPRIIIVDEAHHSVAGTWANIIAACRKACPECIVIGVTATPCRADGDGLGMVFEVMILGPSQEELTEDGYLVPYRVVVPPRIVDVSKVKRSGKDLDKDAQAELLDKPKITGNAVGHYLDLTPLKPAIVCCTNIKHARHVAESYNAETYKGERLRFAVVTGADEDEDRDRALNGLADGSLHGICQVDIAGEGTDIPSAEVLQSLRLTDSLGLFDQQAGRVSRPVYAPGFDLGTRDGRLSSIASSSKPYAWYIDHVGNVGRMVDGKGFVENHGVPGGARIWSLVGRAQSGTSASPRAEGEAIVAGPVQCPKCYATYSARPKCTELVWRDGQRVECGHVFGATKLPHHVEGKLVEITAGVDEAAKARAAQGAARSLEQLKALGMDERRAAHIMAARVEKDELRAELRALMRQLTQARRDHGISDLLALKPKQLRAEIDRLRSSIGHLEFMGQEKTA